SHLLDFLFFYGTGKVRADLARWLVDTEGDAELETAKLKASRSRLERSLYLSTLWRWIPPETVASLQGWLQTRLAERARFRLERGRTVPKFKTIVGFTKPVPPLWRVPFLAA